MFADIAKSKSKAQKNPPFQADFFVLCNKRWITARPPFPIELARHFPAAPGSPGD
jgi:hypothetical protein